MILCINLNTNTNHLTVLPNGHANETLHEVVAISLSTSLSLSFITALV